MVKVYFETSNKSCSFLVAIFVDEETYNVCLPTLLKRAENEGYILTESVDGTMEIEKLN